MVAEQIAYRARRSSSAGYEQPTESDEPTFPWRRAGAVAPTTAVPVRTPVHTMSALVAPSPARLPLPLPQTRERVQRPMTRPVTEPKVSGKRLVREANLRWQSPITMAVLTASFLVSLLCFYVSAYARVTSEVFELSRLRQQVVEAKQHGDSLRAEVSRLSLPGAIEQRALKIGLRPAPPSALQVIPQGSDKPASPAKADTVASGNDTIPGANEPLPMATTTGVTTHL